MPQSCFCDYSDAYMLVSGPITITGPGADDNARETDERNKRVIFKDFAPFTDWITEINNNQIDHEKYLVMQIYNLNRYSDNYSKLSERLWHYYRDKPNPTLTDSELFKIKVRITGSTPSADNIKFIKKPITLENLSVFLRTLITLLNNCETNLILTWSTYCNISFATGKKLSISDIKLFVPVVTLSFKKNINQKKDYKRQTHI